MTTKLSKAQQGIIDRLVADETIKKSWMSRTWRGRDYKTVSASSISRLIDDDLVIIATEIIGSRRMERLSLTPKARALYDSRNAQPETPAPVAKDAAVTMTTKLSQTQLDTLNQAASEYRKSLRGISSYVGGWFYPSRYELAEVYTTNATCKALCGRGLLEYETLGYAKRRGEWIPETRYRITEAGLALNDCRNAQPPQLDGLADFLAALAGYVSEQIKQANKTNRFTADICDYHAAWFLGFAERRQLEGDDAQYRAALRRVQYYQNGAALARGTGRPVRETKAGSAWAVVPAPVAALDITELDPDYDNDVAFEDEHEEDYRIGRLQI